MSQRNKGFTLIELLVVIAIIGILSSVVLASLNQARARGADAAIKANLNGIRAQAELVYDGAGCYNNLGTLGSSCTITADAAGTCEAASVEAGSLFRNTTIAAAITAAGNASAGTGLAAGNCVSAANGTAWAISVPLKTDSANGWCIDSNGNGKQVTVATDRGFSSTACE